MSVAADIFGATRDGGEARTGTADDIARGGGAAARAGAADTRRRGLRRSGADSGRRPGGRPMAYERPRVATSTSPHRPTDSQEVGWGAVVITALSTALVLAGFLGLAQWRAGDVAPVSTSVVQVGVDESLTDVGERITAVDGVAGGGVSSGAEHVGAPSSGSPTAGD
ncbi:hypothetical protein [Rhodococcus gannanensis]|uniref:Uncharacterized protein n=1 Tax=Rhodococcus gannanensis TaxID=1960308 RepID=A0ABW4P6L5_9NOCA